MDTCSKFKCKLFIEHFNKDLNVERPVVDMYICPTLIMQEAEALKYTELFQDQLSYTGDLGLLMRCQQVIRKHTKEYRVSPARKHNLPEKLVIFRSLGIYPVDGIVISESQLKPCFDAY